MYAFAGGPGLAFETWGLAFYLHFTDAQNVPCLLSVRLMTDGGSRRCANAVILGTETLRRS
jgi:hypothetical protein